MAKAIKREVTVKPARPAVIETSYTLTLSKDEAQVILNIVGSVGGSNHKVRPHTSAIYGALRETGLTYQSPSVSGIRAILLDADYGPLSPR